MGLLKSRFSSLRGRRCSIDCIKNLELAIEWIASTEILHNMMISFNDEWEEVVVDVPGIIVNENGNGNDMLIISGAERRGELKRIVLEE